MIETKLLIEQHIHGAYGVDFNKADSDDIVWLSQKLFEHGIGGYFPTLVTDDVTNIRHQIEEIKKASEVITPRSARILGIHLEGIFINPEKKGIHNPAHILPLAIKNYKLIEDDFIKIVTLAPELDKGLIPYLLEKEIKVQGGHCVSGDLHHLNGVTHLFNAMTGISHRGTSTALTALLDNKLYTEIIGDGVHLSNDILNLIMKVKALDKIILISDALPITNSDLTETIFADEKIFYDGAKATSESGTLAGSTTLLDGIVKNLHELGLFNERFIENPYEYHNINLDGKIIWDDEYNIIEVIE